MRYVAVFAGARDNYQVAHALAETGILEKFVTEFYGSKVPKWIPRVFPAINSRLNRRKLDGVPDQLVSVPLSASLAWALHRLTGWYRFRVWKDAIIGRAAGRIATASKAGLFAYSYYASYAFESAPEGCVKIIFQVQSHPQTTRDILHEELRIQPFARASLLGEPEMNSPPGVFDRLSRESHDADFVLTPTTFSKRSLMAAGIPEGKIAVVPYGVDANVFRPKDFLSKEGTRALRLVFVGSLVQRKGLSYLLESLRRLKGEPIELTLIGRGSRDDGVLQEFADVPFRVLWNVPRDVHVQALQSSDVFVFPSLVESFGLVILEAMAIGLPVLTTSNTAGPDLLTQGRTGFVGGIRDVDFLVDKIRWFMANRDAIAEMGRACQEEAARRTWPRFREEVRSALSSFQGIGRIGE